MKQQRTKVILPLAVSSLDELVKRELRFPTIYCDPPWQYEFTASDIGESSLASRLHLSADATDLYKTLIRPPLLLTHI